MMDDMPESSITSNRRWMRKPRRALRRAHAPPKYGRVYVLWAEGTTRFKIGFSSSDVRNRAADIESCSPYPIRIVGDWAGTTHIESMLHSALVKYRSHREWFILPEDAAWWLLLGKWRADVPAGVTT